MYESAYGFLHIGKFVILLYTIIMLKKFKNIKNQYHCLLFLSLIVMFLTGCSNSNKKIKHYKINKDNIKVGFVFNSRIDDEGYGQAHNAGRQAVIEMGIPTLYVEDISDVGWECYDVIIDLIEEGCNVIYANSYGFMPSVIRAAEEHPEVIFGHCAGDQRRQNISTYFGKMYEARYLAGIVAGMKTKTNKIGYVAAYQLPECIRGINAFALGVQSVNKDAIVEVEWTETWYDPRLEKAGAIRLFEKGCDVIEQHQDTPAAQLAAQDAGAFSIGYNFAPANVVAPNSFLTAPVFHWEVFIKDDIERILAGTWESRAYWEGIDKGMVDLSPLTELCAPGTQEKVDEAKRKLINRTLDVFAGPIYDNKGVYMVTKGDCLNEYEIWNMDWFVKGVNGDLQ